MSALLELPILLYVVFAVVALLYLIPLRHRRVHPFPPGPKPLPFIGNYLDFLKTSDWWHWAKHKDLYGPISCVSLFGQRLILLNDRNVAHELLETRSGIYSDRPAFTFAKMCGMQFVLPMIPYNDVVKAQRKLLHQTLGSKSSVSELWPIVEAATHRLFSRIIMDPENFMKYVKLAASGIMLKVVYGYTLETTRHDPLVQMADTTIILIARAFQPAAWLVDMAPCLQYLPDWLPGSRFKQTAKTWRKMATLFTESPILWVKQQIAAGTARTSIASTPLVDGVNEEEEHIVKWAAASAYAGGSDTTVAMIHAFFLAMVLCPEVQKNAQAEIDEVVGFDRLPTFMDRESLPYVNAVFKEVLRWHNAVPLGISHSAMKDDLYNGYFIPKGSILIPNIWLYNHDSDTHHEPFTFNPHRFLENAGRALEPDPMETVFGFGRRLCSGRLLVDAFIWFAIATCLSTLDIDRALDEAGNQITPVYEMTTEELSHPKPFKCRLKVRSAKANELIESVVREHPDVKSDAEAVFTISTDSEVADSTAYQLQVHQ